MTPPRPKLFAIQILNCSFQAKKLPLPALDTLLLKSKIQTANQNHI